MTNSALHQMTSPKLAGAVCPGCAEKLASLEKVRAKLAKANRYNGLISEVFEVLQDCAEFKEATRSSYVQGELLIWLNQCLEANKITVDEYEKLVSRIRS